MGAGVFGPDVLHLSLEAKTIAFYGCLGLAVLCVVIGATKELRVEAGASVTPGHRRRMIAIAGMFISGIAFLTFAAIYSWPRRPATPTVPLAAVAKPSSPQKPWKHELGDLYNLDFNLLSTQVDPEIVTKAPDDPAPIKIRIIFRVYQDFNSGTDFVSIFIPVSHDIRTDKKIYDIIQFLRDQIKDNYDNLKKRIGTGMGGRGIPYSEGKDLKFSGRVFIYTIEPFTPIQIGDLMKWYQDTGLSLQIRGYDYWYANKDR